MSEDVFQRRVRVPDDVLYQTLPDGETVFLDLASEQYFGLDAIATQMWSVLVDSASVAEAHARLVETFDADADTLRADLVRLTQRLADRGLLELGD